MGGKCRVMALLGAERDASGVTRHEKRYVHARKTMVTPANVEYRVTSPALHRNVAEVL